MSRKNKKSKELTDAEMEQFLAKMNNDLTESAKAVENAPSPDSSESETDPDKAMEHGLVPDPDGSGTDSGEAAEDVLIPDSIESETDSDKAMEDGPIPDPDEIETSDAPSQPESVSEEPSTDSSGEESSADDILDDVRRSLIEDENVANKKKSKWWKRIGIGKNKAEPRPEEQTVMEEIDLPTMAETEPVAETKTQDEPDEYLDQIDELIDLLDNDEVIARTTTEMVEESPPESEKAIDIEELKKLAFQPRASSENAESVSEVRSIALGGEDEVFVEVEAKTQDPWDERLKAFENAIKPYRTYINLGVAFLGIMIAVAALMMIYNIYQRARPAPVVEEVSNLPFPNSVALPGGWTFKLGKGSLQDGRWNPQGPEWLQGTEVCRWVSLPWSRQLEAVLRTLNPDDPIELGMSNNDTLIYKVYSIRQMSADEMQQLDSNSPCLLILLAEKDADKSWVLTALP